jgi:hypothetical protein
LQRVCNRDDAKSGNLAPAVLVVKEGLQKERSMTRDQKAKHQSPALEEIERVGAGGEVGEGQSGAPLHKPLGRRDRELGERERVGAGGLIGEPHYDHR